MTQLDADTERALAQRAKDGDRAARDRLVMSLQPLARLIAGEYGQLGKRRCSLDRGDLVAHGLVGACEAVDAFDASRGTRLWSFARPRIRCAILTAIIDAGRAVRLPARQIYRLSHLLKTLEMYAAEGRDPDADGVAILTGLEPDKVRDLIEADERATRANERIDEDGESLVDRIADSGTPAPDAKHVEERQAYGDEVALDHTLELLGKLSPREAQTLVLRAGIRVPANYVLPIVQYVRDDSAATRRRPRGGSPGSSRRPRSPAVRSPRGACSRR